MCSQNMHEVFLLMTSTDIPSTLNLKNRKECCGKCIFQCQELKRNTGDTCTMGDEGGGRGRQEEMERATPICFEERNCLLIPSISVLHPRLPFNQINFFMLLPRNNVTLKSRQFFLISQQLSPDRAF